jgi:hypothetical protein
VSADNCDFTENIATTMSDPLGGAGIYASSSTLDFQESRFEANNASQDGGAALLNAGSATFSSCEFSDNTAGWAGGAVYTLSSAYVEIDRCLLNGNSAPYGGAINNYASSSLIATNSLVINNAASVNGGAVHNHSAYLTLIGCTVADNTAGTSGDGVRYNLGYSVEVNSCIFRNGGDEMSGVPAGSVLYSNIQGGFVGAGNINADPLFISPSADNYRLSAGSPCIDAADSGALHATDLDGNARYDDSATPNTGVGAYPYYDMGCFEYIP